ncbi:MAG: alanine dehydrogenase [Acidobacteriia bacterium]|nr:alanine dehydrogenase [Terriglobia bacterium]
MNIGFLKEPVHKEHRTALIPSNVRALVEEGHSVYFEQGAGEGSHFKDEEYLNAGARIAFSHEEVLTRSELLLKVSAPNEDELQVIRRDKTIMAFFHLAVAEKPLFEQLLEKEITSIGYEVIETLDGRLPVLLPISEIAGQMSVFIAAHLLESNNQGRGILLGGAPGIPPASVVVLGAGVVGTWAAETAAANGAHVMVLDSDVSKLRALMARDGNQLVTAVADSHNIERAVRHADVLIGAVSIHGGKTPHLVTQKMVGTMKPGSVIIDVSIDQGGSVETSRPTTLSQPTFTYNDVIHYCCPNLTANIARTASIALSNASLPYVRAIAEGGTEEALRKHLDLARGVFTYRGTCTREQIAEIFGAKFEPLDTLTHSFIWS